LDKQKVAANHEFDRKQEAIDRFYENLGIEVRDCAYYAHPIGIGRRKSILELLDCSKEDNVLDLGCGDGDISKFLVRTTATVTGVDLSPTRIARAEKKGIKGMVGNVMSTHLPDGAYTKIICSEVIEHLLDPGIVLLEVARLLAHDGRAVVTVPIGQELHNTLLDASADDLENSSYDAIRAKYDITDTHLSAFTIASFGDLVEGCGLEIEKMDFTYEYRLKTVLLKYPVFLAELLFRISFAQQTMLVGWCFEKAIMHFYERSAKKHHLVAKLKKRFPGA
jgi:SAM-dependent methyltransferase